MKKWIRLFNTNHRSDLEETLNQFIENHDNVEISVWQDKDEWWNASARYTFPNPPTYTKDENNE